METFEKNAFEKSQNFREGDFVVVGVGQLQERKGVFDFIELNKRHPEIKFIWVGGFRLKDDGWLRRIKKSR